MIRIVKFFRNSLIVLVSVMLCMLVYGFYSVPDELYAVTGQELEVGELFTVSVEDSAVQGRKSADGSYKVEVKLLGALPVKSSSLTVSERPYVIVSGEIFGLRLFTTGVVVVKIDSVDSPEGYVSPGGNAGLAQGDIITAVDGKEITDGTQLSEILSEGKEKGFEVEFTRNGEQLSAVLYTAFSQSEQKHKAGLWVRDSAAGIGTMTFLCDNGAFAGLGHGVCDVDTGELLPLSNGDIVPAKISGCNKGESGKAGELCGTFASGVSGVIFANNDIGLYGVMTDTFDGGEYMPVALPGEVKTGYAQIISTVDSDGPTYYDVNITKVSRNSSENKNLIIEVTDSRLLEKTGGIVQGMSGSPIIQDGMLVGAVTHVFLSDSAKGYGIFAESMLSYVQQSAVFDMAS